MLPAAAGSSRSASSRPAGPAISRSGMPRCPSVKARTIAANSSGRVIEPRWPVRSSTAARAFGISRRYSDEPSTGTTWSRCGSPVMMSVGAVTRASRPQVAGRDHPRPCGHSRQRNGAATTVRSDRSENARRALASGIAASISGRSRNGVSARNSGPRIHGARRYIWCRGLSRRRERGVDTRTSAPHRAACRAAKRTAIRPPKDTPQIAAR